MNEDLYNFYFNQNQKWSLVYRGTTIYTQWWNQSPEDFLDEIATEHIKRVGIISA